MRLLGSLLRAVVLGAVLSAAAFGADESKKTYDIPAGEAVAALRQFAAVSGRETLFAADAVRGVRTPALKGRLTAQEAIDTLLAGTGLVATTDAKTGAIAVRRESSAEAKNVPGRPAEAEAAGANVRREEDEEARIRDGVVTLGEFEVFGRKLVNADLPRSREDVQPYVVFSRGQIDASHATNLAEFFQTRLPMNQNFNPVGPGGNNQINLRGLGVNQTLMLLDGRRLPPRPLAGSVVGQADINGIPLNMIERIEILPSTASGIYGGGATGGVINIVTRKDYAGVVLSANYANTFDTDASTYRFDINGSFQLRGGATNVTFNASRRGGNMLLVQDRDLVQRSRAQLLVNNPAAVFGTASPPVGFTTNVRSQNGSNLVLKTGTPLNSPNTFVPVGYPGPAVDGGAALVGNAGRYNLDLPDTLSGGRAALQTVPDNQSFGASLRHRLSDRVELLFDAARFENRFTNQFAGVVGSVTLPATAVSNPFTSAINVVFPPTKLTALSETWSTSNRVLAGVVVRLPRDWSAGLDYVWSRAESGLRSPSALVGDPDGSGPGLSYTAALANGSLNVMRDLNAFPLDYGPFLMPNPFTEDGYTLRSDEFSLRGSGPVYRLPAGPAILSASAQVRDEEIASGLRLLASTLTPTRTFNWDPPAGLKSRAYTGELLMPVFAGDAAGGWRRGLQVQLAGRRDEIKVNARALSNTVVVAGPDGPFPNVAYLEREYSATKATAGFKYQPVRDLAVRASWGTGFLAPSLAQLAGREPVVGSFQITDPKRGNQQGALSLVNAAGGNPNLLPEESESLSGGLVLTPRFLPGFRLSVDYTRITKTDEIGTLSFDQLLALEDRFPERITRAPLTPQDQALGYTGGVVQGIDNRSINIAGRRVSAWDIQVDYTWNPAGLGRFEAYALATYQPDFSTKPLPDQPFTQVAGDLLSLLWRGNGGLNWTKGRVSVGWNLQYLGSYRIYSTLQSPVTIAALVLNQGSPEVAAQIYHDVQVRYDWGNQPRGWRRVLAGTQLTLGVQNVFDSEPSITPTVGFVLGSYSPLGDPRLRRYVVNLQRQF